VTDKWGWSDDGSTTYKFTSALDAYAQANSAYGAANNRVLKAGDTMTGQLNISSGGLLVTGNVGINTTSPTAPLTLVTPGSTTDGTYFSTFTIRKTTANSTAGIRFDLNNTALFRVGTHTGGDNFQIARLTGTGAPEDGNFWISASTGNVGIGTTSPGYKLDVSGDIHASNELYLDNGKYLRFTRSSGGLSIQTLGIESGTDNVRLLTTGDLNILNGSLTSLMTIKNAGNVGIGTTSPTAKLDVFQSGSFNTTTPGLTRYGIHLTPQNATVDTAVGITFGAGDSSSGNTADAGIYSQFSGSYGTKLYFATTNDYGAGSKTRMMIDHNGNVGIGTTTPITHLHVASNGANVTTVANTTNGDMKGIVMTSNVNTNRMTGVWFSTGTDHSGTHWAGVTGARSDYATNWATHLSFYTHQNATTDITTATERMRIHGEGYVTTPYQPAFHVFGGQGVSNNYVVYPSVYVNRGSHYNTSTGSFTAPVAGLYIFFWDAIGSNSNDVHRWYLRKNGSTVGAGDVHLRQDTGASGSEYATNGSRVAILNLAVNDYVQIFYIADGGTASYAGADYVTFGGYLLG
jgi:hypothetical protein